LHSIFVNQEDLFIQMFDYLIFLVGYGYWYLY